MSNKEDLNIPQPDPAWDYYILWHSLHHIKAKVDETLQIMNHIEKATPEIDQEIRQTLVPASNKLIEIINELPDDC
ncbi:hypothetical protein [Nostoc sp.]|uniref:hypothetical protein n=1 Tax=Nostoc sp. TaxID=1180 RepID=UPI002FF823FE